MQNKLKMVLKKVPSFLLLNFYFNDILDIQKMDSIKNIR